MQVLNASYVRFSLLVTGLALASCDQDMTAVTEQPLVQYLLFVSDHETEAPIESVQVRITDFRGDTTMYYTDKQDGKVDMAQLASARTLFVLSKEGYGTRTLLDTLVGRPDTVFHRPILRTLEVRLVPIRLSTGGASAAESTRLGIARAGR